MIMLKESYRAACDAFLSGFTKTEACRKAGFKQPKHAAARIFEREDVKLYLKQKQEKLAKAHDTEKQDIADWCWKILKLDPMDVLVRDEKGAMRIDLDSVRESARDLWESGALNFSESTNGRKVTTVAQLKDLASMKRFAVHTLCQMYGFYDNSVEVKGELSLVEALKKGKERVKSE